MSEAYRTIYADPPWSYERSPTKRLNPSGLYHAGTATVEEICAMAPAVADDAVLFLWATAPLLPEALRVMTAWGFVYRTSAIWDKRRLGCGYWFRVTHEHLLVGLRGNVSPPKPAERLSSVISVSRGRHSEKPGEIRTWIADNFPAPRLEMFARHIAPGWDTHGSDQRQRLLDMRAGP